MDKFQNKYRIPSARLSNWDYGSAALYFITICTQNRICFFGDVVADNVDSINILNFGDDSVEMQCIVETQCIASLPNPPQMQLSEIGKIVESEWLKTFELRPDMNLIMGEFVVMPNHFHAIIGIGKNPYNTQREKRHNPNSNDFKNHFGPQSKNLASIVRGFKSSVTIVARKINPEFKWQSRFHDHIIRDDNSCQRIANYIIQNPAKWRMDTFYQL
jgi:putative transposase